jgi:two-component system nitrate/nitrite response regulator NarL
VIIMSVVKDQAWVDTTIEAGAIAYLTKERDLSELADVIRAVHRGETPRPPTYAFVLSQESIRRPALTLRERQVMVLRAEGFTLDAIGRRLGITVATVKTHVDRIRQKYLDVGRPIINPVDWRIRMEEDQIRGDLPLSDDSRKG